MQYHKLKPKPAHLKDYKNLSNKFFLNSLKNNLSHHSYSPGKTGFDRFCHVFVDIINKHAPLKKDSKGKS